MQSRIRRYCICVAAAVLLLTYPLTAQTAASSNVPSGSLRIAGTDTMKELMGRWIASFTALHPGIHVDLSVNGALTAAPTLAQGSADLVPLGRELTPGELEVFRKSRDYGPTAIPVALGSYDQSGRTVALAFFVHQSNPLTQLSFRQLQSIYCKSQAGVSAEPGKSWGDVGITGKWAAMPIHPIGVNFPDGISNFIRLRICKGGEFRAGIRTEHTGGPVNVLQRIVTDVSSDPDAIGYAGFANLQPGTKIICISNGGRRCFSGTRQEVAKAEYPLTRFIYIYLDRKPGRPIPASAMEFLRFVLSPAGQALVGVDGIYMPLTATMATCQSEALQQNSTASRKGR